MKQSATSGAPKGVSVTTDAVAVLKQTVLKQPVQAEPTANTETNQDPPSMQHLATSGAPKGATVTRNAGVRASHCVFVCTCYIATELN
jgi:hypothetical protein